MQPTNTKKIGRKRVRKNEITEAPYCAICRITEGKKITRGTLYGVPAYKDENNYIYNASTSALFCHASATKPNEFETAGRPIKIKLFLTYLDNNENNEAETNTRLHCQLCFKQFTAVVRRLRLQLKAKKVQTPRPEIEPGNPAQMELFKTV